MQIQKLMIGDLPVLIVDNFFNDKEAAEIWKELVFLSDKFLDPNKTGTATENNNPNGTVLKKNKGIFIPQILNPEFSFIMAVHQKLFSSEVKERFTQQSNFYDYLLCECNYDVLLSRYNEDDYYKPHIDTALLTCITWMHTEPKKFTGGDFLIGDNTVETKNNRTVIFPSCLSHGVTPVTMTSNELIDGRFSVSAFITPTTLNSG